MKPLRLQLKTTTPILGGAPVPRQVDEVDIIRVPTIRGHLRFWWRALYAHECRTAEELASRERALWGGVGGDEGTRSRVELRVEVARQSAVRDPRDIAPADTGAYALWPARQQAKRGVVVQPAAPRWKRDLRFQLDLMAPPEHLLEVENAIRAWVLWGGYGGRTRRGLGSLTVVEDTARWLPANARSSELRRLFGGIPLLGSPPSEGPRQVPVLKGARLLHGRQPLKDPERSWAQALDLLRDFRQGQARSKEQGAPSSFAREWVDPERKDAPERPGRSHWPEADKIRLLLPRPDGKPWAHTPRTQYSKSKKAAWPRAGFGLPLAIRFQRNERPRIRGGKPIPYATGEPDDVELRWQDKDGVHKRLASPLIIKAMPLSDGTFVPIALWLCRAWPEGDVVLVRKEEPVPGSRAPFDQLLAPGDTSTLR